jgi:hypothetical protein
MEAIDEPPRVCATIGERFSPFPRADLGDDADSRSWTGAKSN